MMWRNDMIPCLNSILIWKGRVKSGTGEADATRNLLYEDA